MKSTFVYDVYKLQVSLNLKNYACKYVVGYQKRRHQYNLTNTTYSPMSQKSLVSVMRCSNLSVGKKTATHDTEERRKVAEEETNILLNDRLQSVSQKTMW